MTRLCVARPGSAPLSGNGWTRILFALFLGVLLFLRPTAPDLLAAEPSLDAAQNAFRDARAKYEQAEAAEASAHDAFLDAKRRLDTDPSNAPANRRNKVHADRLQEAEDAKAAWERAEEALDNAGRNLGQANEQLDDALRARRAPPADPDTSPEGRRLGSRINDGLRALEKGYAALEDCDDAAFAAARRRAQRVLVGLAMLADQWLIAPAATSTDRGWGAAAHEALNRMARDWKALEARWEANCTKEPGCPAVPAEVVAEAATEPPDSSGSEPGNGAPTNGGPQAQPAPAAPLAQDLACPAIDGSQQQAWLNSVADRAAEQFGEDNTVLFTRADRDDRVVLFTLHRARLYDLAGQIIALNQLLPGNGRVDPGSLFEAGQNKTVPAFVDSWLAGDKSTDALRPNGQRDDPGFEQQRRQLDNTLDQQRQSYNETVQARDAAAAAQRDASARVEDMLDADWRQRNSSRRGGAPRGSRPRASDPRTEERTKRELANRSPEFREALEAERQAKADLAEANAAVRAADDAVRRHPLLGTELEGRRLIDILNDPGVGEATKSEYIDNALFREIEDLTAEFVRISELDSFDDVARELLHPSLQPVQDYAVAVLNQFCLKSGGRIMTRLREVYTANVKQELLDERETDLYYGIAGAGLLVILSGGTIALVAYGAAPVTLSVFLAGVGSVDVAVAVDEYAVTAQRLKAAQAALAQRQKSSSVGTTNPDALDVERGRVAKATTDKAFATSGVVLTIGGELIDLTEASVKVYRLFGETDEVFDAGFNVARTSDAVSQSELPASRIKPNSSASLTASADSSELATARFAPDGIVANPAAARTMQAVGNLPPGMRPAVGEIGGLTPEIMDALQLLAEESKGVRILLKGNKPFKADEIQRALGILRNAELTIGEQRYVIDDIVGVGGFGIVFSTKDGRVIRFAASDMGEADAIEAAYGALEGIAALGKAGIDDIAVPDLLAVGTQNGLPRIFVSERIPAELLNTSPEEMVQILAKLSEGGLVWMDAKANNAYRGQGILDPDLLGLPSLEEANRVGYFLGIFAATPTPPFLGLHLPVLYSVAKQDRKAALMNPYFVNLALMGGGDKNGMGLFKFVYEPLGDGFVYRIEPGKVSLEYLAENFPYFSEFRSAIENLAPGEFLSAVPPAPVRTVTDASVSAESAGVVRLLPADELQPARTARAGLRAGAQATETSRVLGGNQVEAPVPAGGTVAGPFTFMATAAPLCWKSLGTPIVVPAAAGGGWLMPFYSEDADRLIRDIESGGDRPQDDASEQSGERDRVGYAEPDKRFRPEVLPPDDPFYRSRSSWGQAGDDQWALKRIGFTDPRDGDSAWDQVDAELEAVTVAVLDTGLDFSHPDLPPDRIWTNSRETLNGRDDDQNGYVDDLHGWDFVDNDADPADAMGHGTHVAGIIAAATGNGIGIAGINPRARIMPLRIINAIGSGRSTGLAAAIFYAVEQGADVINLSIGGEGISRTERLAIDFARSQDVVVVAAAGNLATDVTDYGPAGLPSVISVAATDYEDQRAPFSNWGNGVTLGAPGIDILSLRAAGTDLNLVAQVPGYEPGSGFLGSDGRYYLATGTSFAAPFVSGVASLLRGRDEMLTSSRIERILRMWADDAGLPGWDRFTGAGRLNAQRALAMDPAAFLHGRITGIELATESEIPELRIEGYALGENLDAFSVELQHPESENDWTVVARGSGPVNGGLLGRVPLTALTKSPYYIFRVVARDGAGNEREGRYRLNAE